MGSTSASDSSAPSITAVSPSTLPTSSTTQPITITGSGFTSSSTLVFNYGSQVFTSDAARLLVLSATEITYQIGVGQLTGDWTVKVVNGTQESTPFNFTVSAPPPPTTGSLTVKLSPASAVSAGAQWRVDGGTYHNDGDTVTGLTPGSHTVSFKTVAGFNPLADQVVSIVASQTYTLSASYTAVTQSTYTLTVNSDHGGVARNPERATYSSGETVRVVAYADAGWHFDHWSGDASGTISFTDVVMDRNKTITANYAAGDWSVGAINVTIQPSGAVAAGARWKADGGDWQNNGVTMNDAYLGDHYLQFSDVPGWTKPAARSVTVTGGQTTNVIATYTQDATSGTLIVTITPPEAVTAGAKWRLNGTQYSSGASVSLPPGSAYTVTFDAAPGWTAPGSQSVTIQPGQTTLATGNYSPPTGQPVIGSIRPSIGRVAGGTLLTIDGANFDPPVSVTIDGKPAGNVIVVSSTRVTCLTPPRATYRTVPVTVQTAGGTATSPTGFTYGVERGTNLNLHAQLGGAVTTAAVQGNHAFIGQGSRLVVLDISNPSRPVPVGSGLQFAGMVNNIKIDGNYAFIANAEEGLQVVNIANPTQPTLVGTFTTAASAQSVAVLGGRAYIASTSAGLQIVDVSEPSNLRQVGSVATDGWAFDVTVNVSAKGIFAYVANLYGTLKVVNVTVAASASVVSSLNIGGNCYSVVYAGNRVYVGSFGTVLIVDVSTPTNPTALGSFSNGAGPGIAYSSGYIFTVGFAGLRIVDVTTPGSPSEVGALWGFSANPLAQVTLVGGNAFVSAWSDGFRIIDVSNRTAPIQRGQYVDFVGYAGGVALANNTLYVANDKQLEILDVHDPITPVRRSPFSPAHQAQAVRIFYNRAFIIEGGFVEIVDVSNPQSLTLLGTIPQNPVYVFDLFSSGGLGYFVGIASSGGRPILRILDLAQPSVPAEQSSSELSPGDDVAYGIAMRGNFAYIVLRNSGGLRIVDVSNPRSPQLRGLLTGLEYVNSVTLSTDGTYALVACETGLKIVDVRNPDNPQLVGSYAQEAYRSEVVGDLAYVAAGSRGVLVLDISDRTNPRLVRSYDTPESARAVAMNGSTLYVADGYGGFLILTIPDAEPPEAFITNPVFPALSPVYTNTTGSQSLGGGASDNVGVTRVAWSNSRGGGGEASGTESWFVSGAALQPGTNVLTVTAFDQAGNSGNDTLTVIYQSPKQNQTITFPALANRTFGDAPIPLAAAASSGLPVSLSVVSGPASSSNNVLSLLGAGAVTVRAGQPGNDFFNPAPPVDVSFNVAKADQAIAFAVLPDKSAGDPPFALTATASSGLPVYFDIVSGPAVLDTNVVMLLGGGMVAVSAWQPGNSNYNAAVRVQRSFNATKLAQFITFGSLSRQTLGDAPFPLAATASSGLPVSFSLLSGPARLDGNLVTVTNTGLVVVRTTQGGDAVYAAAAPVDQSFIVALGNNVITDARRLPNGKFTLTFAGEFGMAYVVECSTNSSLTGWLPLTTNFVDSLGNLGFTDAMATNRVRGFYRVKGQ